MARTGAWSVGAGCCGRPGAAGVDDVAFLEAVVRRVSDMVPVDEHWLSATAMSNGGLMVYRLACESDLFAAIGPTAATLVGECLDPAPVSVIAIHGTADEQVRYDGDAGNCRAAIDGAPCSSCTRSGSRSATAARRRRRPTPR